MTQNNTITQKSIQFHLHEVLNGLKEMSTYESGVMAWACNACALEDPKPHRMFRAAMLREARSKKNKKLVLTSEVLEQKLTGKRHKRCSGGC